MPRIGYYEKGALFPSGREISLRRIDATSIYCDSKLNLHSADAMRQVSTQDCAWFYENDKGGLNNLATNDQGDLPREALPECRQRRSSARREHPKRPQNGVKRPIPPIQDYSLLKGTIVDGASEISNSGNVGLIRLDHDRKSYAGKRPNETENNEGYMVIAKFNSTLDITRDPRRSGYENTPRFFNEVHAYAAAREAQGEILPYVFGLYQDDGAIVSTGLFMIMEYLPFPVFKYMDSRIRAESIDVLRKSASLALETLHSLDVSHGSIKSDQVLICSQQANQNSDMTHNNNWFVVLIDLQFAKVHNNPTGVLPKDAEFDRIALREAFYYCGCGVEGDETDKQLQDYIRLRQTEMGYC
ncbi:MAG: hypothetical protein M1834_001100 [Cirrosporium novae-zelandiae]|nr:MAG: hypothetical protein M1834_001100 [Cirrosporium novae-zelandiae]